MKKTNKILTILGCTALGLAGIGFIAVSSTEISRANADTVTENATNGACDFTATLTTAEATHWSVSNYSFQSSSGYFQSGGTTGAAEYIKFYNSTRPFSSSATSLIFSLKLGAGSNSSTFAYSVSLVDSTGTAISSSTQTFTDQTLPSAANSYSWTFTSGIANAYGFVFNTTKIKGWNSRLYSGTAQYTYDKTYDALTTFTSSANSLSLAPLGTSTPTITVNTGANPAATWSTSDSFVADVDASTGTITAVGAGSCQITATSVGKTSTDESMTATIAVTVSALNISDLRGSDNLISSAYTGKTIAVTGTVTRVVEGSGVYIQTGTTFNGARAVYGYNTMTASTDATVGKLCTIKGVLSSYKGLLELTTATFKTSTTSGETITPIAISSDFTSTTLLGHDSVLISLPTLRLSAASTTIVSGTASSVSCALGGSEAVTLRAEAGISSTDATTINAMFGNVGTAGAFSYSGVLGWYNGPQANLVDASQLTLPSATQTEETNVSTFISTYLNITAGTCSERWTAAKAAYTALTDEEKTMFKTGTAYADMLKRYNAWAVANADTALTSSPIKGAEETSKSMLYYIAGVSVLAIATGAFFYFRKKKQA
jgi:hypothetical protein